MLNVQRQCPRVIVQILKFRAEGFTLRAQGQVHRAQCSVSGPRGLGSCQVSDMGSGSGVGCRGSRFSGEG